MKSFVAVVALCFVAGTFAAVSKIFIEIIFYLENIIEKLYVLILYNYSQLVYRINRFKL